MPKEETIDGKLPAPCEQHSDDIKQLKRALYGYNGTTGLIAMVQQNANTLSEIKTTITWIARAIAGTVIGLIIVVVWRLILEHGASLL